MAWLAASRAGTLQWRVGGDSCSSGSGARRTLQSGRELLREGVSHVRSGYMDREPRWRFSSVCVSAGSGDWRQADGRWELFIAFKRVSFILALQGCFSLQSRDDEGQARSRRLWRKHCRREA